MILSPSMYKLNLYWFCIDFRWLWWWWWLCNNCFIFTVPSKRIPALVESSKCRFPDWMQGRWQRTKVDNQQFIYKDEQNQFRTIRSRCVMRQSDIANDRFVVHSVTQWLVLLHHTHTLTHSLSIINNLLNKSLFVCLRIYSIIHHHFSCWLFRCSCLFMTSTTTTMIMMMMRHYFTNRLHHHYCVHIQLLYEIF